MVTVNCFYCKEPFEIKPYRLIKSKHVFCCKAHRWMAVADGIIENKNAEKPIEERFWSKVIKVAPDECWNCIGSTTNGYGNIYFMGKVKRATFVSFFIHHGVLPPENTIMCHTCDNPSCVNPKHLYAGSHVDNSNDCIIRGRHKVLKSHNHPLAKLKPQDVMEIRHLLKQGLSNSEIAERWNVSRRVIYNIANNLSYRQSRPQTVSLVQVQNDAVQRQAVDRIIS